MLENYWKISFSDCSGQSWCLRRNLISQIHLFEIHQWIRRWSRQNLGKSLTHLTWAEQLDYSTKNQLFSTCVLAPVYHRTRGRIPPLAQKLVIRLPLAQVQKFQWLAKIVGDFHQFLSLFLQNFRGWFSFGQSTPVGLFGQASGSGRWHQ